MQAATASSASQLEISSAPISQTSPNVATYKLCKCAAEIAILDAGIFADDIEVAAARFQMMRATRVIQMQQDESVDKDVGILTPLVISPNVEKTGVLDSSTVIMASVSCMKETLTVCGDPCLVWPSLSQLPEVSSKGNSVPHDVEAVWIGL